MVRQRPGASARRALAALQPVGCPAVQPARVWARLGLCGLACFAPHGWCGFCLCFRCGSSLYPPRVLLATFASSSSVCHEHKTCVTQTSCSACAAARRQWQRLPIAAPAAARADPLGPHLGPLRGEVKRLPHRRADLLELCLEQIHLRLQLGPQLHYLRRSRASKSCSRRWDVAVRAGAAGVLAWEGGRESTATHARAPLPVTQATSCTRALHQLSGAGPRGAHLLL